MTTQFDTQDITAIDVLGMMAHKARSKDIPPCLLCMSDEARAEVRALGCKALEDYRSFEESLKNMRNDGNPRAFFIA
jgi:hypothetical protein